MHGAHIKSVKDPGPLNPTGKLLLVKQFGLYAGLGLLAIAFGIAFATDNKALFWQNYTIDVFYFLGFACFGVVLTAMHYAANMTWSTTVRRISEGFSSFLLIGGLMVFPLIFLGAEYVYDWAADHELHHHFDKAKQAFISKPGFAIVTVVFIGFMVFFANKLIHGISIKQDSNGDAGLSKKAIAWGVAFFMPFAYLFTLFVVELIMAVNSAWFSTMFGAYCFIGIFLSGFALLAIFTSHAVESGHLKEAVKSHHLKDLGTWQMGFSAFMMYIGFSQFMLIWYANLPAETAYFMARMSNGWENIFLLLPTLKWVIPFIFLMPWKYRSNPKAFKVIGTCVLLGQWLDLYWMVMPGGTEGPAFNGLEVLMFLGFAMIFGWSVLNFYSKHSMLAHKDPKLITSVNGQHL